MRSGGPRLICSPYFVIVLFIILIFVSMKYYSISTENETLLLRLEVLQNQMKMTSSDLKNLDSTLNKKNDALLDCNNQKIQAEEKSRALQEKIDEKDDQIYKLREEMSSKQNSIERLKSENVNLYLANDTVTDSLSKVKNELELIKLKNSNLEKYRDECLIQQEEMTKLKEDLSLVQNELASLKAEKVKGKEEISIPDSADNVSVNNLSDGQLPDVNPGAVHVRQPALQGNTYHQDSDGNYLPILPRGNPNAPRAKPKFSVTQLKENDTAASINSNNNNNNISDNENVNDAQIDSGVVSEQNFSEGASKAVLEPAISIAEDVSVPEKAKVEKATKATKKENVKIKAAKAKKIEDEDETIDKPIEFEDIHINVKSMGKERLMMDDSERDDFEVDEKNIQGKME